KLVGGTLRHEPTGQTLKLDGELFSLVLTNGAFRHASELKVLGVPRIHACVGQAEAARFSERLPGRELVVELASAEGDLRATWRAELRDGSHYLRQHVTLEATGRDLPIQEIILLDVPRANARASGSVEGSPVVTGTMFFGIEHPLSLQRGTKGRVHCALPRATPLKKGERFECSSVIGFAPPGQMRRSFLAYLERERAHPYRPFLNYNTWYDLGYFSKYDEAALLSVIRTLGEELVVKRKTPMDSFLLDDGWDDPRTLWRPHRGFPGGFASATREAVRYNAALGFWLSPWGGYGKPKQERLQYGQAQGFEVVKGSFSMAGPKFYERFRSLCVDVVRQHGVNQFKFDGIGTDRGVGADGAIRDFEAVLQLVAELRALQPDIYINQTTGTWPSPFWLWHADSIWRGGDDHAFAGVGSDRQKWITYRDADVYERIVSRTELYPLNSLMLHGIIYAQHADKLNTATNHDFTAEVRAFFGSGTQMQELYITPRLLTSDHWDTLATTATWARDNADTLRDTHWIGGHPAQRQVYGWAAWSPRKGIVTLRNPDDQPHNFALDIGRAFELPSGAATKYTLHSPWVEEARNPARAAIAGAALTITLKPFEVATFEAIP
ncbi:MAG: enterotoxin, partial [Kiritimatiellaeota bacterium]|nr:enterotoxin [Kiritimatiellota bacterium]